MNGRKFTSKVNGGTIFFPAAGRVCDGELYGVGSYGTYWSSTLYGESRTYGLGFDSSGANWNNNNRYYGNSVRPVR